MCSRCLKALSSIKISWHHINQVKVKSDQNSKYKYPLSTHNVIFFLHYEYVKRRQSPDLRPLWLLVGLLQPSDLSSLSAGRSIAPYSCHHIYFCYIIFIIYALNDFYDLSAWGGCWFVVYIRRFIYKFLNVCPFDYTAVAVSGKVGP